MAKPWSQVEASPGYQNLSSQQQLAAKRQYFTEVVMPKPEFSALPELEKSAAAKEFMGPDIDLMKEVAAGEQKRSKDIGMQFGKGIYDATSFLPYNSSMREGAEAIPQAKGIIPASAKVIGQAAPTIAMVVPAIAAAGALPGVAAVTGSRVLGSQLGPTVARATGTNIAKQGLGFGMFEAGKASLEGQPLDEIGRRGLHGLAMGAGGAAIGAGASALFPFGIGSKIAQATAQGGLGAAMAPEGERAANALVFGALGALGPTQKPKTPEQVYVETLNKTADVYRRIISPGKRNVQNIEIKGGKDIQDSYRLAAEEGLIIGKSPENKIDTSQARAQLKPKIEAIEGQVGDTIRKHPSKPLFQLADLYKEAKQKVREDFDNDLEYQVAIEALDKQFNATITEKGKHTLNGIELHKFKQGMWQVGYDKNAPTPHKVARKIGFVAKKAIEDAYNDKDIKNMNAKIGKYETLNNLLESSHDNIIHRGKLGKYAAQVGGAMVGSKIPIFGTIGGWYGGGKLNDFMSDPTRITTGLAVKMAKAKLGIPDTLAVSNRPGSVTPEVLGGQQRLGMSQNPIGLPAPKDVPYNPSQATFAQKPIKPPFEGSGKVVEGERPPMTYEENKIWFKKWQEEQAAKNPEGNQPMLNNPLFQFNPVNGQSSQPKKTNILNEKGMVNLGDNTKAIIENRPFMADMANRIAKQQNLEIDDKGYITLYHGTRSSKLIDESKSIKAGSYFATSEKVAKQYAFSAQQRGKPIVMKVKVDPRSIFPGEYWTTNESIYLGNDGRWAVKDGVEQPSKTNIFNEKGSIGAGFNDLNPKVLKDLAGRSEVSKQFILDLKNKPEVKQSERDIIGQVLNEFPEGRVPVEKFLEKLKAQLVSQESSKLSVAAFATAGAIGVGSAFNSVKAEAGEDIDMGRIRQIESSNNPKAHNKSSNARGLGQITPIVLKEWNNFHKNKNYASEDLFDADINNKISDWYMNKRIPQMLKAMKLKDTPKNRLIAYNAGIAYVKNKKPLPKETRDYIDKYNKGESK